MEFFMRAVSRDCSWRALITTLIGLALGCELMRATPDEMQRFDVCVYGGSEAGFTAAIQVARSGHSVVLIEPTGHAGGMLVEGIAGDIRFGSGNVISGITREVFEHIEQHYDRTPDFKNPGWRRTYEPHVAEGIINAMLDEHEVPVIRGERLLEGPAGVTREDDRIIAIQLENGTVIHAQQFIDASIEGDLLHFAGVTTETIREGNARYGESRNGIYPFPTHRQFEIAVDPYVVPGDPNSGLIATIQDVPLGETGAPDAFIQGFCFRVCLTDVPENRIPITQPSDYDPANYEIYRRYLAAGGKLFRPRPSLPNRKTDLGSWHDLSANLYGENVGYPAGSYAERDAIVAYHESFTRGLIWFLQNDPSVPETTRREWSGWGLPRDEYGDNGGWPRRLYIRSARRMVSDYVITEHHLRRDHATPVADPVAVAWWPSDMHHAKRVVHQGRVHNEGFVFAEDDWRPFGISWRALVPKASECTNLATPTCVSSSYVGYGSVRILPTFMMLGQSAATLSVQALESQLSVQDINYSELRQRLIADGMVLSPPENWKSIIGYDWADS